MEPGRTVILSDTHMGRPGSRLSAEALRPLWAGAARVIFNGDTAELHLPEYRIEAARQVMAMQEMCDADGVELTLLPGNHDPMISEQRYLQLCGGEVFVMHGDVLHPAISPWTAHRGDLRRFHHYALEALQATEADSPGLDGKLDAAAYASHLTWEKQYWRGGSHAPPSRVRHRGERLLKILRVLWYWHTLPQQAARFARAFAPGARFVVFGHIHRAGIWRKGPHTLINTGSYEFPANPRAVVLENGVLSVHRVERRGKAYALARHAVATFALRAA